MSVSATGMDPGLVQAHKLAAIGQVAAGIAHELATPIQYVGDNLRFLESAFEELVERLDRSAPVSATLASDIPEALAQALEGTRRATEIIRAMRSLAHPGRMQPVAADINQGLEATLLLARSRIGRLARVTTEWGPLPTVMCHPGLVNQVFLNLLVNAADAIEAKRVDGEGEGGRGRENGNGKRTAGEIHIRTHYDGATVEISVSDDGCGIPGDVVDRIFDPFFTTKSNGLGTGQGLSIGRRLIEDVHGGTLTYRPNVRAGATFVIRLPAVLQDRDEDVQ